MVHFSEKRTQNEPNHSNELVLRLDIITLLQGCQVELLLVDHIPI